MSHIQILEGWHLCHWPGSLLLGHIVPLCVLFDPEETWQVQLLCAPQYILSSNVVMMDWKSEQCAGGYRYTECLHIFHPLPPSSTQQWVWPDCTTWRKTIHEGGTWSQSGERPEGNGVHYTIQSIAEDTDDSKETVRNCQLHYVEGH